MSFKLRVSKFGSIPVLTVCGDVTGNNISKMTAKLESIHRVFSGTVLVDLGQTTFIDSHGLGVLVFFFRRFSDDKRRFVFLKPSEFVKDLFCGSNLDKIFPIINDKSEL